MIKFLSLFLLVLFTISSNETFSQIQNPEDKVRSSIRLEQNDCDLTIIVDVDIVVNEVASTLMNPLGSDTVTVRDLRAEEGEGFTFTPALMSKRFKAFVEVIRDVATEDPETLKLSDRGGLMYSSGDTAHKESALVSDSPAVM